MSKQVVDQVTNLLAEHSGNAASPILAHLITIAHPFNNSVSPSTRCVVKIFYLKCMPHKSHHHPPDFVRPSLCLLWLCRLLKALGAQDNTVITAFMRRPQLLTGETGTVLILYHRFSAMLSSFGITHAAAAKVRTHHVTRLKIT